MDDFAKILIVDDNPKYLSEALPMFGYTVEVVTNGVDALKSLEKENNKIDTINLLLIFFLNKKVLNIIFI